MRVLVVKMSSLGDVVHALPGVTDAARALGDRVRFDWVVEEAFAAGVERTLLQIMRRVTALQVKHGAEPLLLPKCSRVAP